MVVAGGERTYRHIDEGPIRRVRRTRSPNATGDSSNSSHSSEDDDNGIRIGPEYQADIPEFSPENDCEMKTESMLVWTPHPEPSFDSRIDKYSSEAKELHGYNLEQALGMLFWHKHSIDKAWADLVNFTPFPDEWSVEDRALFEQAFGFYGKCFHKIQQMLPDKSVGCLVKYYYSWKKTRSRTSLIDHQANKIANSHDISDDEMEEGALSDDTSKDNVKKEPRGVMSRAGLGSRRVDCHARMRNRRKPPRGMYLNQECLMTLAAGPLGQEDTALKQRKADLVELKRQVQNNKQALSVLMEKSESDGGINLFRIQEGAQKINGRWTNEELLLAVQGVRMYGRDFKAIAEVIGNKTESLVRSFFVNYRRRYNLDEVFAEYEKENGKPSDSKEPGREEAPMDVDRIMENGNGAAPGPSTPEPSAPEPSAPGPSAPGPSALEPSTPGPSAPGPSTPEPLALEPSATGPSAPGPSTPGPSTPEPSAPEPSAPEQSTPEQSTPGPSADDFASSSINQLLAQDSVMPLESVAQSLPASVRACDEGNSVDATTIE